MASSLLQVPAEIVELIAQHLGLSDLRVLRLVCREVNAKVTAGRRFKGFCIHKNVELRKPSLEKLGARLCEPGVQQNLEHLTVTGCLIVTKGLERIIRERTKPTNLKDPCCLERDNIGNHSDVQRVAASQSDVEDAMYQLSDFKRQIDALDTERAMGNDVAALTDLFDIIKTHCKAAGLKSLTLNLVVRREKTTLLSPALGAPFRQVWEAAQHMTSVSLQAWQRSAIKIERLDVFSRTEACGIQTYTLADPQNQTAFQNLFTGLKALSLSISNRLLPLSATEQLRHADKDERRSVVIPALQDLAELRQERMRLLNIPSNITGLADCLRWTGRLEELSIHDYWIINSFDSSAPALAARKALLKYAADNAPLPELRRLSLGKAEVEVDTLLKLLKNSPRLKSLTLREVTITPRNGQSWETIFGHVTSNEAELTHVYFDNLFEDAEQQHSYVTCFTTGTEPGEDAVARFARLEARHRDWRRPSANGWNAFELHQRERILRGILYQLNPQYIMGSVQNSAWIEQRRRNHGPLGA